jgi:hypothetical protein
MVINNWRSSHAFPLNALHVTLRGRAKKVDPHVLTAQRLKRLSSIDFRTNDPDAGIDGRINWREGTKHDVLALGENVVQYKSGELTPTTTG